MKERRGRFKVPTEDLKKCEANKGKDVRITLRSGLVYTGMIWSTSPSHVGGSDPILTLRIWGAGLRATTRNGVVGGAKQPFKAASIVKFEYLWEVEEDEDDFVGKKDA
jgi:hypothetical protein